jgi:hypothetical protein
VRLQALAGRPELAVHLETPYGDVVATSGSLLQRVSGAKLGIERLKPIHEGALPGHGPA